MKKEFLYKNKLNFLMSILMNIGKAAFNIYVAFILKDLTELAVTQDLSGVKAFLIKLIIFILGFVVIGILEAIFENRYIKTAMSNFKRYCLGLLFKNDLNMSYGAHTGKNIAYFTNNMDSVQNNYVEGMIRIFSNIVLVCFGLGAMIYLSPIMAVLVIVVSLLPVAGSMVMSNKVAEAEKDVSDKNKSYVEAIRDAFAGYTVIKNFGAEKETITLLENEVETLEKAKKRKRNKTDFINVALGVLSNISIVATFVIGFFMTQKGMATVGMMIAFIQLLNYVLGPIEKISNGFVNLSAGKKMIAGFMDELMIEQDMSDKQVMEDIFAIELKDVCFSYGDDSFALTNINMVFEKGKSYAIVGSSGSGKTSLLNLIAGMVDQYEGNILLDGVEITQIKPECKYKLFSIIQQNVIIFNSTIQNNITMWKKDFNRREIMDAVKKASLERLIEEKSLDYLCGENGANLSGGEKQRISVARAILQKASVILTDEGTSALDKGNADSIESLLSSLNDKIVISVTHNLEEKNLMNYDEIVMMRKGKIIERGSFEELMQKKEHFWAMYTL